MKRLMLSLLLPVIVMSAVTFFSPQEAEGARAWVYRPVPAVVRYRPVYRSYYPPVVVAPIVPAPVYARPIYMAPRCGCAPAPVFVPGPPVYYGVW